MSSPVTGRRLGVRSMHGGAKQSRTSDRDNQDGPSLRGELKEGLFFLDARRNDKNHRFSSQHRSAMVTMETTKSYFWLQCL